MMNIVIVGAGRLGRHVAEVLSKENNVILIDIDQNKLEKASWNIDVATRHGSGTDWQLLDDLLDLSPNVLIAFTDNDETNLVCCAIAKHLGYPFTIARINDIRFLNRSRIDFSQIFSVDYFLAPDLLAAHEVLKYIVTPRALAVENFAHGAVQLRTIAIPETWQNSNIPIAQLNLPKDIIVGLIRRTMLDSDGNQIKKVIFPHGNERIIVGDEATFIGEAQAMVALFPFFGLPSTTVKSVVIVGGSLIGFNLANILTSENIHATIVEKDFAKCSSLREKLPRTTIIHHDGTDLEFLKTEQIRNADLFAVCTKQDETNLSIALLGKEAGCRNIAGLFGSQSFFKLAQDLGISHTVSPMISITDHILSQVLTGTVTSLISFYNNQAEIVEVNVSTDSRVVGIPIFDLGSLLPQDFLIAIIQNRGRIMIATGSHIISPGDTVIVVTSPEHIPQLSTIF